MSAIEHVFKKTINGRTLQVTTEVITEFLSIKTDAESIPLLWLALRDLEQKQKELLKNCPPINDEAWTWKFTNGFPMKI